MAFSPQIAPPEQFAPWDRSKDDIGGGARLVVVEANIGGEVGLVFD
jgi:hypothetical protein